MIRLLLVLCFLLLNACTSCPRVDELVQPVRPPYFKATGEEGTWRAEIDLSYGGRPGVEYLNPYGHSGKLWFVYRYHVYEQGLISNKQFSVALLDDDPMNLHVRQDVVLQLQSQAFAPYAVATLDWKIVLKDSKPSISDWDSSNIGAVVLQGTEVRRLIAPQNS